MSQENEWKGVTRKCELAGFDFYIICIDDSEGRLHRITIVGPRTDADFGAFAESTSELINLCIEYQVPLSKIISKLLYTKGSTAGLTNHESIRMASSILDFVGRYIEERYRRFL